MRISPIKMDYFSQVPFKSAESKAASNESLRLMGTMCWNRIAFREEKDGITTSCTITAPKRPGEDGSVLFESSQNGEEKLEDRITAISWHYSRLGVHNFKVYGSMDKEKLDALSETIDKIRNGTEFKVRFYNDWSSKSLESQLDAIQWDLKHPAKYIPKNYHVLNCSENALPENVQKLKEAQK